MSDYYALGNIEYVDVPDEVTRLRQENEQLLTTLRGISTCSSCGVCRGAALKAIGDRLRPTPQAEEIRKLRTALRYWLPDETMIPKGHESAWNEHAQLIPEQQDAK